MKTLYIIGNGFDRHHGLPTRYSDFHKFINQFHTNLENELDEYFTLSTGDDSLWANIEHDLGTFDYRSFFDEHCEIDIMAEGFKPSETYGLEGEIEQAGDELIRRIREAFTDWIGSIDITAAQPSTALDKQALFINFNYTHVLQEVYGIPQEQILHIHGKIQDGYGDLVLGHNKTLKKEPELDENGDSNRTLFTDAEGTAKIPFYQFKKPVKELIQQYEQYFKATANSEKIYVLGHSLNAIDLPYFKQVRKLSPVAEWHVSFYTQNEKNHHALVLSKLGEPESAVRFIQL